MNNTKKRQLNIRNKLISAIAMLLVSSIMMVSTTYAWFTLSTAPEVQGITTTVGANGNLEIALSPLSGDSTEISSAMGDSNIDDLYEKNLTWGNLLDLNDSDYKLDQITLLPTRLNATGSTEADLVLSEFPLQTPTYGADGRVSGLEAQTYTGTMHEAALGANNAPVAATSFISNDFMGVRAVGTANEMSEYEATLNSARSTLSSQIGKVQDYAEGSLNANGGVLMEMAILHASAGETDNNSYTTYVPTLRSVVNTLTQANNSLEQAIRAALRALASTQTASDAEKYDAAMAMLDGENTLQAIWEAYGNLAGDGNTLTTAYSTWLSIGTKLANAETALQTAEAKESVGWNDVSGIMTNIMNSGGTMSIGGKSLSEFKTTISTWQKGENFDHDGDGTSGDAEDVAAYNDANNFVSSLLTGLNINLGSGTGVYYDFATVVGDLDASFKVNIKYDPGDGSTPLSLSGVPATMTTTYGGIGDMNTVKLALASAEAIDSENSSAVIDETYGYIVDLFFRTNASGSKLKLQTTAAQRIYSDSANTDTLGNGSTMTFRTGAVSETTLRGLMESIRVVFFDPDSLDIHGVAKLDTNGFTRSVIVDNPDGQEDIVDLTAPLKLYSVTANNSGALTFGEEKAETNATLCELPANTATAVSVLVYLDGDSVTNEDVASSGSSAVGTLNLQFASDAELVPMTNTALKTGTGSESYSVTFSNSSDATVVPNGTTVAPSTEYYFGITGTGNYTVSYTVGEGGTSTTITGVSDPTSGGTLYTIPASAVTDDIIITITGTDSTT